MIVITKPTIIDVPADVAICPKCGGKLAIIECDEWWDDEHSEYLIPANIKTQCEHEPMIENPEWREWFDYHYDMPYVYWLPVDRKIMAWFQKNYRYGNPTPLAADLAATGTNRNERS